MSELETARAAGSTALSGMKEICAYVGKSEKTIKKYICHEGFPANKLGGEWESSKVLIDAWRLSRLEQRYINQNT